ncbi:MAG: lysophospholipid acyltransferase family protein [Alphaproteobacteria bacterium]|nr:lysophospholipid acyltransferase family protein [Alphaproteobacteria bacterium]
MLILRSLVFQFLFFFLTMVICVTAAPGVFLTRRFATRVESFWAWCMLWVLKATVDIDFEVRGREHLPDGPMILASKHQSAWDTIVFAVALHDPVYVLKRDLLHIPVYGWYLHKLDMIAIDRDAGISSMKNMIRHARRVLDEGRRYIIIFPEGSRVAPGERDPYQPGVAGLYGMLGVPVVPVALNSGLFWGRRKLLKYPGIITLEFLPAIAPGMAREAFMAELEERIETASDRLIAEAQAHFSVPGGGS